MAQGSASLAEEDQISLHFTLGKAYADIEDNERSFHHLRAGNALRRSQLAYNETGTLNYLEYCRKVYDRALLSGKRPCGDESQLPVFVIGMPRSGSTLVEQILSSHPKVFGAGEIEDFRNLAIERAAFRQPGSRFLELIAAMPGAELTRLGKDYLARVRPLAPNAARIVDKMLGNFQFIALIHLALPNARIIHTRRDPIDTCLSCFSKHFSFGHAFTCDLGELGRYYAAYRRLMEHWRDVLPEGIMLEVQYEDVVADLEGQARRLIAYCGLEWDGACLAFHKTERPVRTASAAQVRQPIYGTSIARWRPDPATLAPLLAGIGEGS
jgi:hypothetical protein